MQTRHFKFWSSDFKARTVVLVWLSSRLWTALFVYIGHASRPFLKPVAGGWEGIHNWWLNPWTTYDSVHFIRIAENGYEQATTAFFPLYPLTLRLAGSNEVGITLWGVVLSNAAFLGALILLYQLTKIDYDERTARRSVLLLALFPTSAYFGAVYTESLFLILIVGCFLLLRKEKWIGAGIASALAALTRNSGLVLSLALLGESFRSKRSKDDSPKSIIFNPRTAIAILPLLAFICVQAYFALRFGSLTAGIHSQVTFLRSSQPNWPWLPVWLDAVNVFTGRALDINTILNLLVTVAVFILIALNWKRQPASYTILLLGIMLMHLCLMRTRTPYTIGSLRYMSTTFPFIQLLALHSFRFTRRRILAILAFIGYALLCAQMSYLFGAKVFEG
ncbi:MAG: hypothetical protein DMF68_08460 [Acidobacteria bacterium]|nr:MAG: hypothetical protein DMF68_08460 [Acidobacteriota bacterium]